MVADARAELVSPARQRACLPRDHLPLPLIPGLASIGLLDRHEQGVVIKPARAGREELLITRVIKGKGLKRPAKQVFLGSSDSDEIDLIRRKGRRIVQVRRAQPPPLDHRLGTDQERIARERRVRLVGRIHAACRTQRQDLPPPLPDLSQKIHEFMRGGPDRRCQIAPAATWDEARCRSIVETSFLQTPRRFRAVVSDGNRSLAIASRGKKKAQESANHEGGLRGSPSSMGPFKCSLSITCSPVPGSVSALGGTGSSLRCVAGARRWVERPSGSSTAPRRAGRPRVAD